MTPNVQVKVRVQARGGKFLGPKVTPPTLTVRIAGQEEVLFSGTFDNSASGTVVATPSPAASRNAIVVQPVQPPQFYPAAGAYALEPPPAQALLIASFALDAPAPVEFAATAYAGSGAALTTSTTLQLWPGITLLDDPGVLITIPGLLVTVTSATYASDTHTLTVQATAEMMCGCPITPQPWTTPPDTEPYWPSYEFAVTAAIPGLTSFPLTCQKPNTFEGSVDGLTLESGTYEVFVFAQQAGESNAGYGAGSLTV